MIQNKVIKGAFQVGLGATSYGMLATFVKLAYKENYTTAEVLSSQFILGIIGILLINYFRKTKKRDEVIKASKSNIFHLMLAGTSTGMTGIFYYLAVKYIPVSIGIVLLMQTVWMGVLLEWILDKKIPSLQKTAAVIIVLIGTILATNLIKTNIQLDWRGIVWGILASISFTTTMFTANRIAIGISSAQRSLYMLLGGTIIVLGFAIATQTTPYNINIFMKWGIILSLFGTIIPPLLMNAGFPNTGIGLGSIVSSLELPVSVMMAYFILNETVILSQWIGILLIIGAVVIMNVNFKKN
ncbi:permease of the drug/metabolite transporter (DMT) superfamily [Flavobacterium enshiense DK69]|uniref:Permease n=1 Tax=Flavobacterium enshiense DK69 TaxID=1107311 RepID=V6S6F8_9FLAO|nr:DMT family transporter [Flavobacterium enshiense]ESU22216.1 permease of the drug/metabolite transporter (DMT) superfamily [Flavobacterium enshiense DK69]KGO97230.1 permease [Flavobacterium enshiense DK69]